MDLTKYKMDVLKEGVLLHFLMFKHDLNIKIKTEVLPKNTKEILELLGKNQRTGLAKLYDRE
jgi:meiotically up-regulated gene 157 (Mug157) protein